MPSRHPIKTPPTKHTQHSHTILSQYYYLHRTVNNDTYTATYLPTPWSPQSQYCCLLHTLKEACVLPMCLQLPQLKYTALCTQDRLGRGVNTCREPQHHRGYHKALISTAACKMTERR